MSKGTVIFGSALALSTITGGGMGMLYIEGAIENQRADVKNKELCVESLRTNLPELNESGQLVLDESCQIEWIQDAAIEQTNGNVVLAEGNQLAGEFIREHARAMRELDDLEQDRFAAAAAGLTCGFVLPVVAASLVLVSEIGLED